MSSSGYQKEMWKLDAIYRKLTRIDYKINVFLSRPKHGGTSNPNPAHTSTAISASAVTNTDRQTDINSDVLDVLKTLVETQLEMQLVVWENVLETFRLEERLFDSTSRDGIWMDWYKKPVFK